MKKSNDIDTYFSKIYEANCYVNHLEKTYDVKIRLLNFSCFNINSVRNKFTDFQEIVTGKVNVRSIAETKVDACFPTDQIAFAGYKLLYLSFRCK